MSGRILPKIIGGVKKHMDAVFLTMGGILLPFGFYLKLERPSLDSAGTVCVITGLVLWLLSYYVVKRKEKREKAEHQAEIELRREEMKENRKLLSDICSELKKLNRGE